MNALMQDLCLTSDQISDSKKLISYYSKQKLASKTTSIPKAGMLGQEKGWETSESCSSKGKASESNKKPRELKSICQDFAYQKSTLSIGKKNFENGTSTEVFDNDLVSTDVTSLSRESNHSDENVDGDKTKNISPRKSTSKLISFETEKCLKKCTIKNQNNIEKINNFDMDQEMAETIKGVTREKDGIDIEIASEQRCIKMCHGDQSEAERDSGDFRACKQRTRRGRSKATEPTVNTKRTVSLKVKRKKLASIEGEVEDQLQEFPKKLRRNDSSSKLQRDEPTKYNGLRNSKRNKVSSDKSKNQAFLSARKVEAISLDDYDKVDLSCIR